MAYTDNKITTADLNDKGIMGLPKVPGLSTAEMQHKFDEIAKDVIVPKFNELCETLDANVPPIILPEAPITPQDGDMLVYDAELGAFVFVQKATTLANLNDVDLTGLANGMYLRYDYPTRSWKATNSSSSVPALDDINDVSITSATNGQCLVYSDGTWVNDNEKLDDLKNVYIHLPQNKQLLAYDSVNDRWTNVDLDGGGHKIEDANGTQLAQRETLQFSGYLKTTDENLNERTVVDDSPETITWANWSTLTDEQKAGKKWLITNIPSADGSITIENLHLAWENPNPTSTFASQTITLDTSDYDYRIVVFYPSTSGVYESSNFSEKGRGGILHYNWGSTAMAVRLYTETDATHLSFEGGYAGGSANDAACVPYKIFTGKNTLTAHFSAIAHDVKATQDYSTIEHVVGMWIDGSDLYEKTINCGAIPNATSSTTPHGITNLDKVVEIRGVGINSFYASLPLPYEDDTNRVTIYTTTTDMVIVTTTGGLTSYNAYVTIRYTKTA